MRHVVMYSGGITSWYAAKLVIDEHGPDEVLLLFADTTIEDADLYRFLDESAAQLGAELQVLREGRDPWQVFFDERYLGNSRLDPCSKILKRKLIRRWLEDTFAPETTVIYLGLEWTETHRLKRAVPYWQPWTIAAPLMDHPKDKLEMIDALREVGIDPPRLYALGFPHNNCGGFCIKAGMAHFRHLLKTLPEVYAYHEKKEQELRAYLDKNVAIMRDRKGGEVKPLTMKAFRERIQADGQCDLFDWGGCGCFSPA